MEKLRYLLILALSIISLHAYAGEGDWFRGETDSKHRVSFIISDQLWEWAMYNDIVGLDYSYQDPNYVFEEKNNYSHTPHIAVEYSYRLKPWFELGIQTDFQRTSWDLNQTYQRETTSKRQCFYNLSFIPQARFVYLRKKLVEMHSGLGVGMTINGGSEVFPKKGHSVNCLCYDLNYMGVSVGKNHWYGTFDLGGTFAFYDFSSFFMVSARIARVGVSYRF